MNVRDVSDRGEPYVLDTIRHGATQIEFPSIRESEDYVQKERKQQERTPVMIDVNDAVLVDKRIRRVVALTSKGEPLVVYATAPTRYEVPEQFQV